MCRDSCWTRCHLLSPGLCHSSPPLPPRRPMVPSVGVSPTPLHGGAEGASALPCARGKHPGLRGRCRVALASGSWGVDLGGLAQTAPPTSPDLAGPSSFSGLSRNQGAGPSTGRPLSSRTDGSGGVVDDPASSDEEGEFESDAPGPPCFLESPSSAIAEEWTALSPWTRKPGSFRRVRSKWMGDPDSSPFAPPRPDPCLQNAFDAFGKSSKSLLDVASNAMNASGAAAHAVLSAKSAVDSIRQILLSAAGGEEDEWSAFFRQCCDSLEKDAVAPLSDATKILASSVAHGVQTVRAGVAAAAPAAIRSSLKSLPPANHYFFGDAADKLTSSMNLALLSAQLEAKSRPPPRAPPRAAPLPSRAPPRFSSSSSSSSARGKAGGRSYRGGKGGQKK